MCKTALDERGGQTLDTTPPLVYQPAQARERLEVSASTLRRMVATYEEVFEALPRTDAGARYYTDEVLERLETALVLRDQGAASLEVALQAVAQGAERVGAQALAQVGERVSASDEMILELVQEVRALTQALGEVSGQLRVQNELNKNLEAERPGGRAPRWWQFWRRSGV